MSTLNMKEEALVNLTLEIVDIVEKIIQSNLRSSSETYGLLKDEIGSSEPHIRNTFGITTGIGLKKYITRRTYTLILEKIGQEKFNNLKEKEKIYNIDSFKYKCKQEFGDLIKNLETNKMQPYMNKQLISLSLKKQLETKSINSMMNSVFKEITEGRELIDISEISSKILIQDNDNIIVDIERSYFKKNNIIFKIDGSIDLILDNDKKSNSLYNANVAIRNLSKFYSEENRLISSIYLCTEWGGKSWGIKNLISSIHCIENNITEIELSDNDFIVFEEGKVYLNTDFYRD